MESKGQQYDVYGNPREKKGTLAKTIRPCKAISELNEDYLRIESEAERRVRISSQARSLHLKAPTVQELRKEGTHVRGHMTFEAKHMMLAANLQDPLKRSLFITPEAIKFGHVRQGMHY